MDHIIIEYNIQNSIFGDIDDINNSMYVKSKTITLERLSTDFVQGFRSARIIYGNDPDSIKILGTSVAFDSNNIVFEQHVSKCWATDSRFNTISNFKQLCDKHNITITKRYSAVIDKYVDDRYCVITVIQFNSSQFIDGFVTYWSWSVQDENIILGIFDNSRSYTLNVEYQLPICNRKHLVKELLDMILLPDLSNMVWEYVVDKCKKRSPIIKCTTEIDIINVAEVDGYLHQYDIYDDRLDEVRRLISSDEYFECANCEETTSVDPFVCKVTLV
jgi:hypothetical protein